MANVNIYVPADLHAQLKRHDINVSRACQVALRRKVRVAERRTERAFAEEMRRSREHPAGQSA